MSAPRDATPPPPVLAVEIGGTKLQAALGDASGAIQNVERAPAGTSADAILQWCADTLPALTARAPTPPAAVGIGFGGPVDSGTGRVLTSHQVEGWADFALRDWFEARLGLPAVVINDANAAGWGEYNLGAGRGTRHFAYMNIGSGIGGALIIGGRLHDGTGTGAAEFGHTIVPDWTARFPGVGARLEDRCSGWSIERYARAQTYPKDSPVYRLTDGRTDRLTCAVLAQAVTEGDHLAASIVDRVADSLGMALANVITIAHPERIALGGGVSLMGDVLLNPLRAAVERYVFGPYRGAYEIVPCALGENVVLAGALLFAGERATAPPSGE